MATKRPKYLAGEVRGAHRSSGAVQSGDTLLVDQCQRSLDQRARPDCLFSNCEATCSTEQAT